MTLSAIASTTFSSAPPASVGHHSAWPFTTFRTRPAPRSVRYPLKAHHLAPSRRPALPNIAPLPLSYRPCAARPAEPNRHSTCG